MFEVRNIKVGYGVNWVVADVSFAMSPGDLLLIRGNNASGKSTLLKGLSNSGEVICSGDIWYNGEIVGTRKFSRKFLYRDVYTVPQYGGTFDDLTSRENLIIASRKQRKDLQHAIPGSLSQFFRTVDDHRAGLLSGGQQKALAVLMGLVSGAPLLFLDEPFAGLSEDGGLGDQLLESLLEAHTLGRTILIAEHRSAHLGRLLQKAPLARIVEMKNGQLLNIT